MIKMENLRPPWQILTQLDTETKEKARAVVSKVMQAVNKLHVLGSTDAQSVHGEVRNVNIMVRSHEMGLT